MMTTASLPSSSDAPAELADQRILVTGSTRGIGRAIAAELLARGATVAIHGRSNVTEVAAELGESCHPLTADLDSAGSGREVVEQAADALGGLDGLVNNAGGGEAIAFRGLELDRWRTTFRLNLEAAFEASQAAYLVMRRERRGSILNVASLAAHGAGGLMGADYAAAKAGLVSLTKSLAIEAARFGIRCNAVSPGFIETDMTSDLPDKQRQGLGIPMRRLGLPEEIATTVSFLMSKRASYVTGQVIHIDGGLWLGG